MHLRFGTDGSAEEASGGDKPVEDETGHFSGAGDVKEGERIWRRSQRHHQKKPEAPFDTSDAAEPEKSTATQRRLLTARVHFNSQKGVRPSPALNGSAASPTAGVRSK